MLGLAAVTFLLVVMLMQRSQHDAPVRNEVDSRGAVTQSYQASLHSDVLAARGKPSWVLFTCSPARGLMLCRGGTPELEIWVQPKS